MNRQIKLLFCAKSIDGGTGTFIFSFLKLKKANIKVLVLEKPIYRQFKNKKKFYFFRKAGFFPQKYTLAPRYIFNFFQELFWLREKINKFKPDVILTIDTHCNLLTMISKTLFLRQPKIILTVHVDPTETLKEKASFFLRFFTEKLIGFFYNRADIQVCVSQLLAKKLISDFRFNNKVIVIYNGIKPKKPSFHARPKKMKDKIIVSMGRFVPQKDFFTLLKAFFILKQQLPDVTLWLIGDGPLKKELLDEVAKMQMANAVKFLGWVKNPYHYIRKSAVFVLSSHREGLPYSLLEAMAQGVPVIATDAPFGPKEILRNSLYGLLTPVGDVNALKIALNLLLINESLWQKYAKKARERALFFSEKKMLHQYASLIDTLSSQQ